MAARVAAPAGDAFTALCWLCCARSVGPPDLALAAGTQRGLLRLYAPDGTLLQSQRLHDSAVVSVSCRAAGAGANGADPAEDISISCADALLRLDALDVASLLRRYALHAASPRAQPWLPDGAEPLRCLKWDLGRAGAGGCSEAACAGAAPQPLYDAVLAAGAALATPSSAAIAEPSHGWLRLVSAGEGPALGAWAGPEAEGGVLAAAAALAATAITAVASAAMHLLSPWGRRAPKAAARAAPSPGAPTEELPPALSAASRGGLEDPPRRGRTLRLAPRGALAAATDSLGRVLLLDLRAAPLLPVRLWKGLRDAQVAWLDGPAPAGPPQLYLALLAPHRGGTLELFRPRHGPRVARLRCGHSRLLAAPPLLGGQAGGQAARAFVLDGEGGELRELRLV